MKQDKARKFSEAVNKAMEEQVVPLLFTPEQLEDMKQPYHEKWDHYTFANLVTTEAPFQQTFQVKPQLAINDPRITPEQIEAAPKTIHVDFECRTYDVPLRVFSHAWPAHPQWGAPMDLAQWERDLASDYVTRAAIEKLQSGLKDTFNFVSEQDYAIGYGSDHMRGQPYPGRDPQEVGPVSYLIQLWSEKAAKKDKEIKAYVEDQLKVITPGRQSEVRTMGRIAGF